MGRAGQLDTRIILERATVCQDTAGGTVERFTTLARIWASRTDASDGERIAVAQRQAIRVTRWRIRSSKLTRTLTPQDRIRVGEDIYEITGIKETTDGRNAYLEITTAVNVDVQPG